MALAERISTSAGLDDIVGPLRQHTIAAAEADRSARQHGITRTVDSIESAPLPWLVTAFARLPVNTSCLSSSDSREIRATLISTGSVAATALRNALTAAEGPVSASTFVKSVANELEPELGLTAERALVVADAFVGGYVVLTLLTLAEKHFTRPAVDDCLTRLDDTPFAGFVRGFWAS